MISALAVAVRNTKTVAEDQQANGRSEASFSHVIQAQSLEVHQATRDPEILAKYLRSRKLRSPDFYISALIGTSPKSLSLDPGGYRDEDLVI